MDEEVEGERRCLRAEEEERREEGERGKQNNLKGQHMEVGKRCLR